MVTEEEWMDLLRCLRRGNKETEALTCVQDCRAIGPQGGEEWQNVLLKRSKKADQESRNTQMRITWDPMNEIG